MADVVPIRAGGPSVAADQLRLFIERAERLHEEVKAANEDLADVFKEAKANGYDTKAMKRCIALRKLDPDKRQEDDAILETYRAALGIA
jgi:uncharacterized protein (UPF0335 family)